MSDMSFRGRSWIFTINNFKSDDLLCVTRVECEYIIYGIERGSAGTPHLQGFIHFANGKSRSAVAKLLPRAYLEKRRGTVDQAIDYCKKEGLFTERGTKPIDAEAQRVSSLKKAQEKYREIIANAKDGNFEWIEFNHPHLWIARCNQLMSMRMRKPVILDGELLHEWWVGKTGTGKSRLAWEIYPNHYQKQLNKWWDGYAGEDVVIIEEWSPKNEVSGAQLKVWADRYPFPGQIKGGTLTRIRPIKVIVLSNYTISECFEHHQDRDPLYRRFHELHFPEHEAIARGNATQSIATVAVTSSNSITSTDVSSGEGSCATSDSAPSSTTIIQQPNLLDAANSFALDDREMLNFLNGLVE